MYVYCNITNNCSYDCSYCSLAEHFGSMTESLIDKVVEFAAKGNVTLVINGGEPFDEFNLLRYTVHKAVLEDLRDIIVITNGSFISDLEKRNYFFGLVELMSKSVNRNIKFIIYTGKEHLRCRSSEIGDYLENLKVVINTPSMFYEVFPDYNNANPFVDLPIDMINFINYENYIMPFGNALETSSFKYKKDIVCPITLNSLNSMSVDVKGNIHCCHGSGCIIGNINERVDYKTLVYRFKQIREYLFKTCTEEEIRTFKKCLVCQNCVIHDNKILDNYNECTVDLIEMKIF